MSASSKLYIGNLEYSVSSQELNDFLAANYEVVDCKVIEGKGFAFVTFASEEVATQAKEALSESELKGRKLRIDYARENQNRNRAGSGGGNRRRY